MPHFRIEALTQTGGWDPFNVTEDADLGFRLARNGWRIGSLTSPTIEEAPGRWPAWRKQRARWFKGWIETVAVLARKPGLVALQLGWRGALSLGVTIAGSLVSALIHGVCAVVLAFKLASEGPNVHAAMALGAALIGYGLGALVGFVGLRRAGRTRLAPWLLLTPLHWLMMSAAALLACLELIRRPHHWAKTRHGPPPSHRSAATLPRRPGVDDDRPSR